MMETLLVFVETEMEIAVSETISDEELFNMAFDALVPFANMAEVTESIELQDLRYARDVLRFLSERLAVAKNTKR